jgi:hypothetical protein
MLLLVNQKLDWFLNNLHPPDLDMEESSREKRLNIPFFHLLPLFSIPTIHLLHMRF